MSADLTTSIEAVEKLAAFLATRDRRVVLRFEKQAEEWDRILLGHMRDYFAALPDEAVFTEENIAITRCFYEAAIGKEDDVFTQRSRTDFFYNGAVNSENGEIIDEPVFERLCLSMYAAANSFAEEGRVFEALDLFRAPMPRSYGLKNPKDHDKMRLHLGLRLPALTKVVQALCAPDEPLKKKFNAEQRYHLRLYSRQELRDNRGSFFFVVHGIQEEHVAAETVSAWSKADQAILRSMTRNMADLGYLAYRQAVSPEEHGWDMIDAEDCARFVYHGVWAGFPGFRLSSALMTVCGKFGDDQPITPRDHAEVQQAAKVDCATGIPVVVWDEKRCQNAESPHRMPLRGALIKLKDSMRHFAA